MTPYSLADIPSKVDEYLAGSLAMEDFEAWVMGFSWDLTPRREELIDIAMAHLDTWLFEVSQAMITPQQFGAELARLVDALGSPEAVGLSSKQRATTMAVPSLQTQVRSAASPDDIEWRELADVSI